MKVTVTITTKKPQTAQMDCLGLEELFKANADIK
jgi:hypothetical protein